MTNHSHHSVRESIRTRIENGEWSLGALIPAEKDLSTEYGCARTTINRALQALADEGLLIRKRKGGTRVCAMPVRYAKFEIPIIREQVEAKGDQYRHELVCKKREIPPSDIRAKLNIQDQEKALYLETIHFSNSAPLAVEERWINTQAVPEILQASFDDISVNEWLVKTVPFSSGDVLFSAQNMNEKIAAALKSDAGKATFVVDRTTWVGDEFITAIKLYYQSGFELYTQL